MRRIRQTGRVGLGLIVAAGAAAGCGDEAPTEVGSVLVGEGLRTVRVVLDAPEFIRGDTTYDQIGRLNGLGFSMVAAEFEGELDAHTLFQVDRPFQVTFQDADDNTVADSVGTLLGGTLTVVLDSLTGAEGPIELAVLDVTEDWHPNTVSWDSRVDTAGVSEPWTQPGGTTGSVLATGTWESGDTIEIELDSASASVWHDTIGARRGGALQVTTPGTRLRVHSVDFLFDVVPVDTDTTVTGGSVSRHVAVASPDSAPAPGSLRVGGTPAWRSLLHFRPLDEVMIPCEAGSTSCEIPLSEVTINTANLLLETQPAGGRRTERAMRIEGRAVLSGPGTPLTRSPLSQSFGPMVDPVDVADFASPAAVPIRMPLTGFVQRNASLPEGEDPILWLALTAVGEKSLFGYGQFSSLASEAPPRLELVVTIPLRKVTP